MTKTRLRIATRYMTRFRCIGDACEEHCCGGWNIGVDKESYVQLRRAFGTSDADRATFQKNLLKPSGPTPGSGKFSYLLARDQSTGNCNFLDGNRLCTIQSRFGHDVLPASCASYPRKVSRVGRRMELSGALSCPEVARLCLLADDAVELVESDEATFGRGTLQKEVEIGSGNLYLDLIDEVRGTFYELMSDRRYPVASRHFFCAYLADQIGVGLRRGMSAVEAKRTTAAIEAIAADGARAQLHRTLQTAPRDNPIAATMVLALLLSRPAPLIDQLLGNYLGSGNSDKPVDLSQDASARAGVIAAYRQRRSSLPAWMSERIERYFQNYSLNHFMVHWYLEAPSLPVYLIAHLLRIAMLRLLLLGHPGLAAALAITDEGEATERLDAAAVEVFYKLARLFEHDAKRAKAIDEAIERHRATSIAHAAALIGF